MVFCSDDPVDNALVHEEIVSQFGEEEHTCSA